MSKSNFWTVERLQMIHLALMALSEEVEGTNYRVIKRKEGLGRLVAFWLRDHTDFHIDIPQAGSALTLLGHMSVLQPGTRGGLRREGYERNFYNTVQITDEAIRKAYAAQAGR